jgi:hypothetical protein
MWLPKLRDPLAFPHLPCVLWRAGNRLAVTFEDGAFMALLAQHHGRRQPDDTTTEDNNLCHPVAPSLRCMTRGCYFCARMVDSKCQCKLSSGHCIGVHRSTSPQIDPAEQRAGRQGAAAIVTGRKSVRCRRGPRYRRRRGLSLPTGPSPRALTPSGLFLVMIPPLPCLHVPITAPVRKPWWRSTGRRRASHCRSGSGRCQTWSCRRPTQNR